MNAIPFAGLLLLCCVAVSLWDQDWLMAAYGSGYFLGVLAGKTDSPFQRIA